MSQEVIIIDGGGANIASLCFALERLGAKPSLSRDHAQIRSAERVILPGVGAAQSAMDKLRAAGLDALVPQLTQPVLGICLGMQLLFESSEEDAADCLGIIPGKARLMEAAADRPVPHMGWNQVESVNENKLLDGLPDSSYFYFVHSYAVEIGPATSGSTDYGKPFTSMVQQGNFMGAQFHPERSGDAGARLLANFLRVNN